jgi:hypothetical protein
MAFRSWLLQPTGGGLAPEDVTFLASCTEQGAQVAAPDLDGPASRAELARAVRTLVRGDGGRRLYVYFAGHGCRTDPVNPLMSQDVVLLTECSLDDPGQAAVGVEDLRDRLAMARFREIVMIVDACRNVVVPEPFGVAGLGRDYAPADGGQGGAAQIVVLKATAPGETAVGDARDGELRGVVSRAVTEGLAGAGIAKIFDDTDESGRPYQVRWSTLRDYVAQAVRGQQPRTYGEGDPILATFPEDAFEPVRLDVAVSPGPATAEELAALRMRVTWPATDDDGEVERPGPAPVTLHLPPRRHRVRVRAGTLVAAQSYDVYVDRSVTLALKRARQAAPDGHTPADVAEMNIASQDPAAVIEVRDASGAVHGREVHQLLVSLPPRSYTAVVIGPDGIETHEPADPPAGQRTSMVLLGEAADDWPRRPGELAWASPSAWIAAADSGTWEVRQRSAGVAVVAIAAEQSLGAEQSDPRAPKLTPVHARPGLRPMTVHAHVVAAAPPLAAIPLNDAWLWVPCLASTVSSIVVSGDRVTVALFDLQLIDQPHLVVLLDRAQHLLGAGRSEAAELLLHHVVRGATSQVAETLLSSIQSTTDTPEPMRRPSTDPPISWLPGTPWAVGVTQAAPAVRRSAAAAAERPGSPPRSMPTG